MLDTAKFHDARPLLRGGYWLVHPEEDSRDAGIGLYDWSGTRRRLLTEANVDLSALATMVVESLGWEDGTERVIRERCWSTSESTGVCPLAHYWIAVSRELLDDEMVTLLSIERESPDGDRQTLLTIGVDPQQMARDIALLDAPRTWGRIVLPNRPVTALGTPSGAAVVFEPSDSLARIAPLSAVSAALLMLAVAQDGTAPVVISTDTDQFLLWSGALRELYLMAPDGRFALACAVLRDEQGRSFCRSIADALEHCAA